MWICLCSFPVDLFPYYTCSLTSLTVILCLWWCPTTNISCQIWWTANQSCAITNWAFVWRFFKVFFGHKSSIANHLKWFPYTSVQIVYTQKRIWQRRYPVACIEKPKCCKKVYECHYYERVYERHYRHKEYSHYCKLNLSSQIVILQDFVFFNIATLFSNDLFSSHFIKYASWKHLIL